jgi:hypothetical protein
MSQAAPGTKPEYAGELSTAIQSLAQAAQLLTTTAAQMMKTMTHILENTPGGLVLKRFQFDSGFRCHR